MLATKGLYLLEMSSHMRDRQGIKPLVNQVLTIPQLYEYHYKRVIRTGFDITAISRNTKKAGITCLCTKF
jgi:hypothetical protein